MKHAGILVAALALGLGLSGPARGIAISSTTDATLLVDALIPAGAASGIIVRDVQLDAHTKGNGAASSGSYTNTSGTYGIGAGIVLSSGDVADYGDGPNTSDDLSTGYNVRATSAQHDLAFQVTGDEDFDYWDVTELAIAFDVAPGLDVLEFDVVFGTEEWPEYVGSKFVDGFGIFLDGVNVALVDGFAVNLEHPDMASIPGTELDSVLAPSGNPRLSFTLPLLAPADPGSSDPQHELTFIVFDTSDAILDTTVYVSNVTAHMPEPGTALLLGGGLAALAARRRGRGPAGSTRRVAGAGAES